jgi:hypothetical protein
MTASQLLARVSPPLAPVFQPQAPLIVLAARGGKPAKLEMPLVEDAISVHGCLRSVAAARRYDEIGHDGSGMPLIGGDSRIEVAEAGFQQRLPDIGPVPCAAHHACSGLFAHT